MILLALSWFGTIIFAVTGAYAAAQKGMDIIGVLLLAFVVGNGGGTLRDIFLGFTPVFWVNQPIYIWMCFATAIVSLFIAHYIKALERVILYCDAIGLGVFVVTGAEKTLSAGYSPGIAIMMGILTAVGGGILRDLICNELPLIMHKEIYVTAALIGGLTFITCLHFLPKETAAFISIGVTFAIRAAAIRFDWQLPLLKHWLPPLKESKH